MAATMNPALALLLAALAIALVTDLRQRKVPNALVAAGMVAGCFFHALAAPGGGVLAQPGGALGLGAALGGIAVGFALLLPLYALRAMGAGDVKLLMMVGAFLGPLHTCGAAVLSFVAGGVLALGMALWQRSLPRLFANLRFLLTHSAVKAASGQGAHFEPLQHTAGRLPYAVAIAAGTVLQLILVRNGGWAFG